MRAVPGLPEMSEGDDLARLVLVALAEAGFVLDHGDVLVVAHKVVSKAEGRLVSLADVVPGEEATRLAAELNKDARKVEVVLRESERVVRARRHPGREEGVMVCRHKRGYVSANAGVDASNVCGEDRVALLPEDPDASARALRKVFEASCGHMVGVIISDTFGRPWRRGIVNVALGVSGPPALPELSGQVDHHGRELRASTPAFADEIAAAAGLLMAKAGRTPVVLVKGLSWTDSGESGMDLLRPEGEDLFL
jgi:coenzyme F420-0:L-glutamate ligase/coenzyme F420-1:gamma-L-glutamate ligase